MGQNPAFDFQRKRCQAVHEMHVKIVYENRRRLYDRNRSGKIPGMLQRACRAV